ncbi:hypothetical protein X896_6230 [Burkholderia pseudomallei ABCPW 1]|nr:hypothetical protein X980_5958 [Burkholderia pseudomallei MSHR4000]KGX23797.1 hypothetical protein X896_6230 [Burkholderia pseudomallei ABCPW 1]
MKFTSHYSPTTRHFSSMGKAELKEFYESFMSNLPYCIEELMQLVRSTPKFEDWSADYSIESLEDLGVWYAGKVEKRALTPSEIQSIQKEMTRPVEIQNWVLTDETMALAVRIGMYYGEVALKNNSLLNWQQQMGSKKLADFGQPVIVGPGAVPLNPVRVANSFAHGLLEGTKTGRQLRDAYDYWSSLVVPIRK